MARIIIIVGHPRISTYCEALGESYLRGALAAGHEAELFVTAKMDFDPILHQGFERVQAFEPDLQAAHDALMRADHLVIIFPLWLGSMPAILKGFLERVLQPEAVYLSKEGKFVKLLEGKSARVIVTMEMPGLVYRWWFGSHELKILKGNIFHLVGVRRVHTTIYGNVERAGLEERRRWLRQVQKLGQNAD